jgi:hypothetical protein
MATGQDRLNMFQLLKSTPTWDRSKKKDGDYLVTTINFNDWAKKYFANETTVSNMYDILTSECYNDATPPKIDSYYFYSKTIEDFYQKYCCDLDWAKSKSYCGGSGNSTPAVGDGSTSTDQTSERQKNINKIYCSLDSNKKVTLANSKTNGWTWDECKNKFNITQAEEDTAKNSCGGSSTTDGSGSSTKPAVSWTDTNATEQDVANGTLIKKLMKGDIVTKIQNHLIKHGFDNISVSKKADGKFGSRTKKAVIDFQISKKLNDDGVVGPKTWAELIKDKSSAATTNDNTNNSDTTSNDPIVTSGGVNAIRKSIEKKLNINQGLQPESVKNKKVMLNKVIKKTLVETKENKKRLIEESKIVKTRFTMLMESSPLKTKKQIDDLYVNILAEMIYLHNQGFDNKLIAENVQGVFGVLSNLFGKSGGAIVDTFKEKGVNWILTKLGLEDNSYFKNFLITTLGNTNITDVPKLFTDCNFLTKKIAESIPEAYLRKLEYDKGLGGGISDVIRNTLYDVVRNSDFAQKLEASLAGLVCPVVSKMTSKFENKLSGMKSNLISPKNMKSSLVSLPFS